jgi:hypothetical protein
VDSDAFVSESFVINAPYIIASILGAGTPSENSLSKLSEKGYERRSRRNMAAIWRTKIGKDVTLGGP